VVFIDTHFFEIKRKEEKMIDLEAIKKKFEQLSGNRQFSKVQLWKPEVGSYKIRALPWPKADPSAPICEKFFYYIGSNSGILAPYQFGKPDPIHDLCNKLYRGTPKDKEIAKKLRAKMRAYLPVIVKEGPGADPKKVVVWSFSKTIYMRLMGFMLDADVGDFLDAKNGLDLKVVISKPAGKQFFQTDVDTARKSTPVASSDDEIQALLKMIPNIDDMYPLKDTVELEKILQNWLDGGDEKSPETDGSTRGKTSDALDALVNDVTGVSKDSCADETNEDVLKSAFDDLMEE